MAPLAAEAFAARLQVGRVLQGWPLVAANALRALAVHVLTFGSGDGGLAAPCWVVVTRVDNGKEVGRLSAGREPGSGEYLLTSVQESLSALTAGNFLRQWNLDGE